MIAILMFITVVGAVNCVLASIITAHVISDGVRHEDHGLVVASIGALMLFLTIMCAAIYFLIQIVVYNG